MDTLHDYRSRELVFVLGLAYIIIYYGIIVIKWLIHTIRYQLDNNYRNDEIAQEKRATEAKNLADNSLIAIYFRSFCRMGETATAYEKRVAEAKKQADETALVNATPITIPVVPSAAATIPSQTTAVMSNAIKRDQREYIHINEMTEAEKRATQARIKQADEKVFTNDSRAVTANTTQRDQPSNNYINEMMEAEKRAVEAEKRAVEAEKRAVEVEKRAVKAKKQATEAKKQADGTTLSNAIQTAVPVALSTTPAVPVRSFDDRINALLKMKASGLITDAEFDHKRKELLDSI